MSYAFDLLYKPPRDQTREHNILESVQSHRGSLDYIEEIIIENTASSICITYEFDDLNDAEQCATELRKSGEHIEGPYDY